MTTRRAFLAALLAVPAAAVLPTPTPAVLPQVVAVDAQTGIAVRFIRQFDVTRVAAPSRYDAFLAARFEPCAGDVVTFSPECGMGDGEYVLRRLV